jgi:hypothetical protein
VTVVQLSSGSPLLSDLVGAIDQLQAGIRVVVQDRPGLYYRVTGVTYDTALMAVVFAVNTANPIVLPPV